MENIIIGFDAKRIVRNTTGLGSYGRTLVRDLHAIGGMSLRYPRGRTYASAIPMDGNLLARATGAPGA